MDKKAFFFTIALFLGGSCAVHAQQGNDDNEISVTDGKGNEELIVFPEAMGYELDSLMNLYMAKTYLDAAEDCLMATPAGSPSETIPSSRIWAPSGRIYALRCAGCP